MKLIVSGDQTAMPSTNLKETGADLSALPSVDLLLRTETARKISEASGQKHAAEAARQAIDSLRKSFADGAGDLPVDREGLLSAAERRMEEEAARETRKGLRRVINAAGVIVHTNLGRAPLSDAALDAIREASGYCNLEYDLETGIRGRRGSRAESMLAELTGAEEALVVNNCAAAAVLVLTSLCEGGGAVISRGELVEIGGDFRVPDVMARSGAELVEVGTTNRTKVSDYANAIGENTRLIVKVHPSNYRIVGFTSVPSVAELAALARSKGLILYEDAGSGALVDLSRFGLSDEPVISESIAAGADVVTFSGDKLLGSVQAGLIVGRSEVVALIRKHPLYRAFRPGKMVYAALEATLGSFMRGTEFEEVPVLRMLSASREEIEARTKSVTEELRERLGGFEGLTVETVSSASVVGGGSAPGAHPGTAAVSIRHAGISANEIEARLRNFDPPVIARIEEDSVLLDLRTVADEETEVLKNAVCAAFRQAGQLR
jgi:L-seryl-tRNA(Ser) seleniumtransferase